MYDLPLLFFSHGFKFQDYVCNGCYDLTMLCFNISDITIIAVKNVDHRCIIHNIGTEMKNSETLNFFPDHLKTKKMCKYVVKKLPYLLRYVPDQYKTQQMGDKTILENNGTLKSVSDCYKNQEMCNKVADNYPQTLKFASKCYKNKKNVC